MVGDSATVKMKLNNFRTNALLDSGARWSVIDVGSLSALGLENNIKNTDKCLFNASGHEMDILGVVDIEVKRDDISPIVQEFKVLNTRTYSNILLGRDYLRKFGRATFDFERNRVNGKNVDKRSNLEYGR